MAPALGEAVFRGQKEEEETGAHREPEASCATSARGNGASRRKWLETTLTALSWAIEPGAHQPHG